VNSEEYLKQALRTNHTPRSRGSAKHRISENEDFDINHSLIGMMTELGELTDVHKKYINYGKEEDLVNMAEEIGDLLWYMAICINALNGKGYECSFESIMQTNIDKLKARYPEKFNEEDANFRDLEKERGILEGGKK
jgi:NTP pyrophosphatase (non-canonical NTP hydrolase)